VETLFQLFWLFIKINLLSTSGMASVGLLHQEAVGRFLTESQFIQAVAFSSILPGSDALQMAMFIGYTFNGMPGALAALLGSILPPTLLMLGVAALLHRLRKEAWVRSFIQGLTPAVSVLMVFVAWKLVRNTEINWQTVSLGIASLIAFLLDAPPVIVLLLAGLAGILFLP